ncbi:MAG: hypothetical protein WD851_20800 [Pirellulales bacterium]
MPQTTDSAPPQYVVQHEFDDEPTYVVHNADTQIQDEDCVTFGSHLPVELRLRLAQSVCDELNREADGQQLHIPPTASSAPAGPAPGMTPAEGRRALVISVSGGVVQEVFAESPAPRVILVDWDTETCHEGSSLVRSSGADGKSLLARVAEFPTNNVPAANSDVSLALAAAGIAMKLEPPAAGIRDPATLSTEAIVKLARRIQALFYLDILGEREFWNPDKEWEGADLLDELALAMNESGLVPISITGAPL